MHSQQKVELANFTDDQIELVHRPLEGKIFLEGPAGAGKTTAAVARLLHLLRSGIPARSVLVVVPQRTLAAPYYGALRRPSVDAGGQVAVYTIGGLAQRMVDLFWPLIAEEAGFAHPDQPPIFLTLETAQYHMARLVRPLLDKGYFESIVIDRNRLYSQIIDNLNKAAVVGFPHTEIGLRLKAAWSGERAQQHIYDEAQECADLFRNHCLAHNLLDFSLQVEVFAQHLWPASICQDYLLETYAHLIVDNVEEDTPVAHDVLREWLAHCRSALVIADRGGGYRRFLGADPEGGLALAETCDQHTVFAGSFVAPPNLRALGWELSRSLGRPLRHPSEDGDAVAALTFASCRYHPQMLDWVAQQIAGLVHEEDVPPGEIAVLAPFLGDALRFSLTNRLEGLGVPVRSHRPSRALREEPATRCLLTLAALAHPSWSVCPTSFEVAYALMQAIEGMDLVRARLLSDIVYRTQDDCPILGLFDHIIPEMQERLTFALGERYERLRSWVDAYRATKPGGASEEPGAAPLDHFLSRLFGEVLSQAGFGFHGDYDAGEVAASLIESVQKFRWAVESARTEGGDGDTKPLGQEYLEMVRDGVIAAQYVRRWRRQPEDAVLLAPAYTFLVSNRPVDIQVWLSVGSSGWWERLYQPLTHPYVLSRRWPRGAVWTDTDEFQVRQDALLGLVLGLIHRCRKRIYLGLSDLGEHGTEQKGPLLQAIQRVLRRHPASADD